jgi:hypothetical protein
VFLVAGLQTKINFRNTLKRFNGTLNYNWIEMEDAPLLLSSGKNKGTNDKGKGTVKLKKNPIYHKQIPLEDHPMLAEERHEEPAVAAQRLIDTLEKQGLAAVQTLKIENAPLEVGLTNILQMGTAAFENKMGRPMTYSELRAAYG